MDLGSSRITSMSFSFQILVSVMRWEMAAGNKIVLDTAKLLVNFLALIEALAYMVAQPQPVICPSKFFPSALGLALLYSFGRCSDTSARDANQKTSIHRMANEETKVDLEDKEEDKTEERRTFRCQFCDRMFASSQALGGHQNGHRRERDAVKRAEHEAELYSMQPPLVPVFSAPPYLHANQPFMHSARSHFRSSVYPPSDPIPRHSYFHPYLPFSVNSSSEVTSRIYPRYNSGHTFLASPYGGHVQRDEEHWKFENWQRNHSPRYSGYPRVMKGSDAAQETLKTPLTPTSSTLAFKKDNDVGVEDGKNADEEEEIDLTLHL